MGNNASCSLAGTHLQNLPAWQGIALPGEVIRPLWPFVTESFMILEQGPIAMNYLLNSFSSERSFLDVCVQLIPSPFIHLLLGSVSLSNQQLFLSSFNLLLSEAQMIQLGTMWWLITGLSVVSSAPHKRGGECTLWKARMWLAAEHTPTQQQVQVCFSNQPPWMLPAI